MVRTGPAPIGRRVRHCECPLATVSRWCAISCDPPPPHCSATYAGAESGGFGRRTERPELMAGERSLGLHPAIRLTFERL